MPDYTVTWLQSYGVTWLQSYCATWLHGYAARWPQLWLFALAHGFKSEIYCVAA